jgi:hypothetical protein
MTAPAEAAPMREDVTQADIDAAEEWRYIVNHRWSEYEGDPVADLAASFRDHRLAHTARPDAGDEDVERVGRAIAAAEGRASPQRGELPWQHYKSAARAALAAMREGVDRGMVEVPREPTEAMVEAGVYVDDRIHLTGAGEPERAVIRMWNAMLEAAAPAQPR